MRFPILLLLGTALLVTPAAARAQQLNPSASYRTAKSQHFRITYTPDLEVMVAAAAQHAEDAWLLLEQQYVSAPKGAIDLVLTDNTDVTNAFAAPFPSPRVTIFVKPPLDFIDLQHFRDWLELAITHELAHIFQIEQAGRVGRGLRAAFGRVPLTWPFFPQLDVTNWVREGLAVEFETRGTGSGRQHGSWHEMVVRTAILEGRFDKVDRFNSLSSIWPGPGRAYIYGSLFNDYLARKHGPRAQTEITKKIAGAVLPPELMFNYLGKRALGTSFTDEYRAWQAELQTRYNTLADSLRRIGVTDSERLTHDGRWAINPRVSRSGRYLAFVEENGRNALRTRVIDLADGSTRWTNRRNGLGVNAWIDDEALIVAQPQVAGVYDLYGDLYRVSAQGETRLTERMRADEPDVAANGRIVAVQNEDGVSRLVVLDANGGALRALVPYTPGTYWTTPRWSPDGTRIAAGRWQSGGFYDVVVVDTAGRVVFEGPRDTPIDASPAWSPDGRYVLFWSDRTGIPNLFALDTRAAAPVPLQVTNVLTGALYPDVSPDGKHIYFSRYHADGFHIERMPYDPASWRAADGVRLASADRPRTQDTASHPRADVVLGTATKYRAWPSVRPYYWLPLAVDGGSAGVFLGVSTSGRDLVGRHNYGVDLGVDPSSGRTMGTLSYSWAGLGNPTINSALQRDWDDIGPVRFLTQAGDTVLVDAAEREDRAVVSASLFHRRWRSSASLTLGAEVLRRHRLVIDSVRARFTDARDSYWGPIARVGYAHAYTPALGISRENGVSLSLAGRARIDTEAGDSSESDGGYRELTTWNTVYRALGRLGFAHHVLAVRFSGLLRDGAGATPASIGGVSGDQFNVGPASIGSVGGLLPVRGFESGERRGTRAWSTSIEYRLPVALIGRGYKVWPVFLEDVSFTLFGDAGDARCTDEQRALFAGCAAAGADPMAAFGGELGLDVAVGYVSPFRVRVGVGQPISGPGKSPVGYIAFGPSF